MNKKIIFILAGVVLTAMTSLTMTSCDDDHFTVDPTIAGKGNVWENISQTPELSEFASILKRVYFSTSENTVTTQTYADLISHDQTFTVWAPKNGTFNYEIWNRMLESGDREQIYEVETQLIRNCMTRYSHVLNGNKQENRQKNPLHPVNPDAGDIKKQVGNTVKAVFRDYQFQTLGELRALLSLYNLTVEEVRGNVRGEDYNGMVYSVNDKDGNKIGNPFKSSLFGKSVGYEALARKAASSRQRIKDKNLAGPTKKALGYALRRTYDKDEFVKMLKEKGIDCVFRYTDEGRLYGVTFIDHRTHCVLNGSRMGKAFSANALERHFNTPPEEQIPFKEQEEQQEQPSSGSTSVNEGQHTSQEEQKPYEGKGGFASFLDALDILNSDNPVTDAEEEAFRRRLQRKKKKRRGPRL